ncbi:MAG: hypothetical protein IKZ95_03585, partial [Lachnospiraceae bacterium]|nr:hypothetical protein [Lachnospiraceae bacterium]
FKDLVIFPELFDLFFSRYKIQVGIYFVVHVSSLPAGFLVTGGMYYLRLALFLIQCCALYQAAPV